jgi:hypothetical protein
MLRDVNIPHDSGSVAECIAFIGVIEVTDFITAVNQELISPGQQVWQLRLPCAPRLRE